MRRPSTTNVRRKKSLIFDKDALEEMDITELDSSLINQHALEEEQPSSTNQQLSLKKPASALSVLYDSAGKARSGEGGQTEARPGEKRESVNSGGSMNVVTPPRGTPRTLSLLFNVADENTFASEILVNTQRERHNSRLTIGDASDLDRPLSVRSHRSSTSTDMHRLPIASIQKDRSPCRVNDSGTSTIQSVSPRSPEAIISSVGSARKAQADRVGYKLPDMSERVILKKAALPPLETPPFTTPSPNPNDSAQHRSGSSFLNLSKDHPESSAKSGGGDSPKRSPPKVPELRLGKLSSAGPPASTSSTAGAPAAGGAAKSTEKVNAGCQCIIS